VHAVVSDLQHEQHSKVGVLLRDRSQMLAAAVFLLRCGLALLCSLLHSMAVQTTWSRSAEQHHGAVATLLQRDRET
jgi:hypothetical protein